MGSQPILEFGELEFRIPGFQNSEISNFPISQISNFSNFRLLNFFHLLHLLRNQILAIELKRPKPRRS